MEAKARDAGRDHICLTVNILWQIWKSRNRFQFHKEEGCPGKTVMKAVNEWNEYDAAQQTSDEFLNTVEEQQENLAAWFPPAKGL